MAIIKLQILIYFDYKGKEHVHKRYIDLDNDEKCPEEKINSLIESITEYGFYYKYGFEFSHYTHSFTDILYSKLEKITGKTVFIPPHKINYIKVEEVREIDTPNPEVKAPPLEEVDMGGYG